MITKPIVYSMANLIRRAKPASAWNKNDLRAYNIQVVPETVATFFGNTNLPPSLMSPANLAHEVYPDTGLLTNDELFSVFMDYAMTWPGGDARDGASVDDFTRCLFGQLRYYVPARCIASHRHLPLSMCSTKTLARPDFSVIDFPSRIILLVQEGRRHLERKDPEPHLIAEAIAAFQYNNRRRPAAGLPAVNAAVIPGITMVGTAPTFYKVDLTTTLVEAVELGEYPTQTTTVHKLTPPVQAPSDLQQDGMRPLNNRAVILSCFEAFKQFL